MMSESLCEKDKIFTIGLSQNGFTPFLTADKMHILSNEQTHPNVKMQYGHVLGLFACVCARISF